MSILTTELKNDHEKLLKLLQEVQSIGLGSDAGRKKLLEGKDMLASHLKKEDAKLYPALKNNPDTKEIGEKFSDEMRNMTADILDFIKRVENGKADLEYAKELGKIISTIRMRISREEVQLYPLYEKNCG